MLIERLSRGWREAYRKTLVHAWLSVQETQKLKLLLFLLWDFGTCSGFSAQESE
jgi:hypothetical protein